MKQKMYVREEVTMEMVVPGWIRWLLGILQRNWLLRARSNTSRKLTNARLSWIFCGLCLPIAMIESIMIRTCH